jgi:Protein of unknown function (DUF3019)
MSWGTSVVWSTSSDMMRLLSTYSLAPLLIVAFASAQAAEEAQVSLKVKPLLCIVDQFSPSCAMKFELRWQSLRIGDYCLNNDLQSLPLNCWKLVLSGELREQRVVTQGFTYWVSEASGASRLAAAKVEVLRIGSTDRRRERRTRHIWDVL